MGDRDGDEVVGDNVGLDVGDTVGEVVGLSEGDAVGDDVGVSVGDPVGETLGDTVGVNVGGDVGDSVGATVGDKVGPRVGDVDGDSVGEAVGDTVGDMVGVNVGASVGFVTCTIFVFAKNRFIPNFDLQVVCFTIASSKSTTTEFSFVVRSTTMILAVKWVDLRRPPPAEQPQLTSITMLSLSSRSVLAMIAALKSSMKFARSSSVNAQKSSH